jgi:hypothetical protein
VRVNARLADDGTLRVRETQTIVFTGDWNGGERRFDVRPRQRFAFAGMQRLESAGGAQAMREYTAQAQAVNERTARLRAERLAREADATGKKAQRKKR